MAGGDKWIATKDDGGSAFPTNSDTCTYGMTLRDYFAAHAIQAAAMRVNFQVDEWIAHHAYAIADAMIAERAK